MTNFIKKGFVLIVLASGLMLTSCYQRTCPTYMKAPQQFEDVQHAQQDIESIEIKS